MNALFFIIRLSFILPLVYLTIFLGLLNVGLLDITEYTKQEIVNIIIYNCIAVIVLSALNVMIILYAAVQYLIKGRHSEWLLRKKIKNKIHAGFLILFSATVLIGLLIAVSPSSRNKFVEWRMEQLNSKVQPLEELT